MLKNTISKENQHMKLQGQPISTYKNKQNKETTYMKFWINLPAEMIKRLGWKPGDDIRQDESSDKIILSKKK